MFLWGCAAQTLSRGDGPRHSLHASTSYHEHNQDLIDFLNLLLPICTGKLPIDALKNLHMPDFSAEFLDFRQSGGTD